MSVKQATELAAQSVRDTTTVIRGIAIPNTQANLRIPDNIEEIVEFAAQEYAMQHPDGEILAARLGTIHNLYYYLSLMQAIREAIEQSRFAAFSAEFYALRGGRTNAAANDAAEEE